jgi:chromate transporter
LCIALAGLLLPSAAITVLMTAGFAAIQEQPVVVAAMRGVIPATIGLSLAMGVQMARGLLDHARREGRGRLVSYWMLLAAAALLYAVGRASPVAVLGLSGVAAVALLGSAQAALRWARERTRP